MAVVVAKPAAKRHNRRVAGEALVPVPARKKYPKARVAMARPPKRMAPAAAPAEALRDEPALSAPVRPDIWHEGQSARPSFFLAILWLELKGRLRAQLRRLQPNRILLDQATARYHQLLAEADLTRPSA
ncbi:MAG: hypothetical protein B7Y36_15590 [Novosphingobium sp. 28-62-57]|uniref:hypothetical protein n=1 Tax=unclassified Novosphingobium TaxID=2644732 RepID=UPI000BC80D56|nr:MULTISPECIES: hypothetical protein [unclassified Novosphingobium]OYW47549.1 MAG: hypothetical protein B7Z36_02695 [Novosphingobium sp. 12-63-9]OYZ08780.1 MAG: hypothetical protein B7Y36_15590 [Novosphingobium sp. 28-62-57]OZA31323.1 MAG: hypothetical protein B7X92_14960 [Novosphingobium sp. 17-62-9]HQS71505.1 hypothetical protein [Novosphingobium sp.]